MPYTPLKIHIPEPCSENWEAMSPVSGTSARHCDSCAKNVVDFTGFTDAQVHAHMRESDGKLCGRFRPDQLGRPLRAVVKPTTNPLRIAAAAAGLLVAATGCESEITTGAPQPAGEETTTEERHVETLIDGLIEYDVPMTGEIAPVYQEDLTEEDVIEMTVPGMSAGPPPPPPMTDDEDYVLLGDIYIEDDFPAETDKNISRVPSITVGDITVTPDSTTQDSIVPDCTKPKGTVLTPADIRDLPTRDINSIAGVVMGMVAYHAPDPSPGVVDTLVDLFSTSPASSSETPDQRPRPVPPFLQELTPYPNPFVDEINLEVNAPTPLRYKVELLDASGRRLLRQNWDLLAGHNHLVLRPRQRKLKGQLYYLRLTDENGNGVTKPVVRR